MIPTPVVIFQVLKDTKVVIGDTTIYPVGNNIWESEVQIVDAFQGHKIPMNPDLKFWIISPIIQLSYW